MVFETVFENALLCFIQTSDFFQFLILFFLDYEMDDKVQQLCFVFNIHDDPWFMETKKQFTFTLNSCIYCIFLMDDASWFNDDLMISVISVPV